MKTLILKNAVIIAGMVIGANLGTTTASAQSSVYRSVDTDGNVTFTDRVTPGGKKVHVAPLQTYDALKPPKSTQKEKSAPEPVAKATKYDAFEIISPAPDESVRSNAGELTVAIRVEPELREGDVISVSIDGNVVSSPSTTSIQTLTGLERGSHVLSASIVGEDGKKRAAAGPVTFHLLKASVKRGP
ncbi:MAG: hypothetical protein ACI8PT_001072 [Gammaproteobacteria bacterium]|jgi:hypothetical protein